MDGSHNTDARRLVLGAVERNPAPDALRLMRSFIELRGAHVAVRLAGLAPPSPLRDLRGVPRHLAYAAVSYHAAA